MTMTSVSTVTSRDFARDFGSVKRAADKGPVIITDHGRPAYALLAISDYRALAGQQPVSLLDAMDAIACDEAPGFKTLRLAGNMREVDLDEPVR